MFFFIVWRIFWLLISYTRPKWRWVIYRLSCVYSHEYYLKTFSYSYDDLVVGAPIYAEANRPDLGRIFIYKNNNVNNYIQMDNLFYTAKQLITFLLCRVKNL